MKKISTGFCALAVSFCIMPLGGAAAAARQLDGAELHALLSGNTIYLSAPFGALPISYSTSGRMVAKSVLMAVFSGIYKDEGKWRIAGDKFCQRWQTWNGGKEQCFSVRRVNGTLYWESNDGMSGTAKPSPAGQ